MLFAVNVTAVLPATPANVGVFQAACVAVLAGAYHVSTPDAIAYGIVLQAVELATALLMGLPALLNEGLSWREVRLRTMHAAPVQARPAARRRAGRAVGARRAAERRAGRHRRRARRIERRMTDAWVYMLRCADGSLYTGWSTDVQRRLARHRAGTASRYTASRLPVELVLRGARCADRTRGAGARRRGSRRSTARAKLALIAAAPR